MKAFFVLLAIVAVGHAAKVDFRSMMKSVQQQVKKADGVENADDFSTMIMEGIKEAADKIELDICKRNGTKLYEATEKAMDCVKKSKTDGLICDTITTTFKKCILPIEQVIENCVEAKYHDLPDFLVRSMASTTEFLCNAKVKEVLEIFNPCVYNIGDECTKDVEKMMENIDTYKNVKVEMCSQFSQMNQCLLTEVNKSCKNEMTRKVYSDLFYSTITKPCAA